MNLNELYAEVSRVSDTLGTQINAADVSRVCASLFTVLADHETEDVLAFIAKGITRAKDKAGR